MREAVSSSEDRIRHLYKCRVCGSQPAKLHSVRLSEWLEVIADDYTYEDWLCDKHRYELRTEFICGACLSQATVPRGVITGFLTHNEVIWRLSFSREPVEYDFTKWLRYMRRYRAEVLAG